MKGPFLSVFARKGPFIAKLVATSGRGTSQALIGAYILAGELAAAGGEHTAAFAAYEQQMRGYVSEHQKVGQEGAERFFMGTPTQEMLDVIAANAPEMTRAQIVRPKDYPFAAQRG